MGTYSSTPQSTYSVRLLRPLCQLVREGQYDSPVLDAALVWLDLLDRDARVPVLTSHALLDLIVSITKDETLGVRAAAQTTPRAKRLPQKNNPITVRNSMERASRRLCALSDGTRCTFELQSGCALLRLDNRVRLPPLAEDYQTCGLVAQLVSGWPLRLRESVDIWFRHAEPMQMAEYRKVASGARLHFGSRISGFSFPDRWLEVPLGKTRALPLVLCEA